MKKTLKQTFIWFSCIYSPLTVISSIINLCIFKQANDSYFHLIDRAVVVLIPVFFYFVVKPLKCKDWMKLLIHYAATVLLTMFETFMIGVITKDLAETAYRDQFLNYTIIYIVIAICCSLSFLIKSKKKKMQQVNAE